MYFLICLSLLSTFLLGAGIFFAAVTSSAWKYGNKLTKPAPPRTRAKIIFTLRVLPVALSMILGLGFVLPSFIIYEPAESGETVSLKLAVIIAVSLFGVAAAVYRSLGSWWKTRRLIGEWSNDSQKISLPSVSIPAYKLRHPFPVFAVVGILRPRLYIAERLLDTLSQNELAAVTKHEIGHISAWDNLKRLMMRLCGDLLVFPFGHSLDREWVKASETAADEFAVRRGDGSTALDLASALIAVARIIPDGPPPPMPAVSYVFEGTDELLSDRISHLLQIAEKKDLEAESGFSGLILLSAFILAVAAVFAANGSLILSRVHNISEIVLSALQ